MPIIDDVSYHDSSLKCCLHINKATELHGNLGKDHWSSPSHVLCTTPQGSILKTEVIRHRAEILFWRTSAGKEFMRCPNPANIFASTKRLQLHCH